MGTALKAVFAPHSLTGLWFAINWFVLNIGLTDPRQQEAELFGVRAQKKKAEASGANEAKEPQQEPLKSPENKKSN